MKKQIEKALQKLQETKKGIDRIYLKQMDHDSFIELLSIYANIELKKKGKNDDAFIINNENKSIIDMLFNYITGKNSLLDINKGILIIGGIGIGKTLLMKSFIELINSFGILIISTLHSKELSIDLPEKGLQKFKKKPLFIDDVGKENKEVLVFGTRIKPYVDMISLRYEHSTWNFGTSNYKLETLQEMYGETVTDRMKEIFNIIEMQGTSYRK